MSSIGRNETCPCMSGKKYKKCCEQTGIWKALKDQRLNYYDESFVIDGLMENDNVFRTFYNNERFKINKLLFIVQADNTMSAASFGNFGDDAYLIASKHSKFPVADAIHLAHELEHLILWSQGYKYITNHNPYTRAHKFINDLLFDPIINKKLYEYGFDIPTYLKLSDEVQMKIKPIGEDSLLISTLVVKRFLDYRNIYPEIKLHETDFYKSTEKSYPDLIPLSHNILDVIDTIGITNPRSIELVMRNLIAIINRPELFNNIEIN